MPNGWQKPFRYSLFAICHVQAASAVKRFQAGADDVLRHGEWLRLRVLTNVPTVY